MIGMIITKKKTTIGNKEKRIKEEEIRKSKLNAYANEKSPTWKERRRRIGRKRNAIKR